MQGVQSFEIEEPGQWQHVPPRVGMLPGEQLVKAAEIQLRNLPVRSILITAFICVLIQTLLQFVSVALSSRALTDARGHPGGDGANPADQAHPSQFPADSLGPPGDTSQDAALGATHGKAVVTPEDQTSTTTTTTRSRIKRTRNCFGHPFISKHGTPMKHFLQNHRNFTTDFMRFWANPRERHEVFFEFAFDKLRPEQPLEIGVSAVYTQGAFAHMKAGRGDDVALHFQLASDNKSVEVRQTSTWLLRDPTSESDQLAKTADMPEVLVRLHVEGFRQNRHCKKTHVLVDASSIMSEGVFIVRPPSWIVHLETDTIRAFPGNVDFTVFYSKEFLYSRDIVEMKRLMSSTRQRATIRFCMFELPKVPLVGRVADDRVGFFYSEYTMYGDFRDKAWHGYQPEELIDPQILLIQRQRLKQGKDGPELVYYVDPSVPKSFREATRRGVEQWQEAFREADPAWRQGVIRAIIPGDTDWPDDYDQADIRFNTISWCVGDSWAFAIGDSIIDARSGEILKANIVFTLGWLSGWLGEELLWHGGEDVSGHGAAGAQEHARRLKDAGHVLDDVVRAAGEPDHRVEAASSSIHSSQRRSRVGRRTPAQAGRRPERSSHGENAWDKSRSWRLQGTPHNNEGPRERRRLQSEPPDWWPKREMASSAASVPGDGQTVEQEFPIEKPHWWPERFHDLPCLHHGTSLHHRHPHEGQMCRALHDHSPKLWLMAATPDPAAIKRYLEDGIAAVTAHEVGHTLGLRHNFKGSLLARIAQVQDPEFVKNHGIVSSVMDYVPMNTVSKSLRERIIADNHQGTDPGKPPVWPNRVGIYDKWAIKYGYMQLEDEKCCGKHEKLTDLLQDYYNFEKGPEFDFTFATDFDTGLDPYAAMFDATKEPLEYYQDQLTKVQEVQDVIFQRAVHSHASFTYIGDAQYALMSEVIWNSMSMARFVGGVRIKRRHAKGPCQNGIDDPRACIESGAQPPIQTIPAEMQDSAASALVEIVVAPMGSSVFPKKELQNWLIIRGWWDFYQIQPIFLGRWQTEVRSIALWSLIKFCRLKRIWWMGDISGDTSKVSKLLESVSKGLFGMPVAGEHLDDVSKVAQQTKNPDQWNMQLDYVELLADGVKHCGSWFGCWEEDHQAQTAMLAEVLRLLRPLEILLADSGGNGLELVGKTLEDRQQYAVLTKLVSILKSALKEAVMIE